jgi:hypothetical protein
MVEMSMQNRTIGAEANQMVINGLDVRFVQDYEINF